ncbi:aminopeptidase P N-terminal domain-containing protein [Geitlerinema sp. PCC 9228]|jgi:Xaa-Pro aminopeptidase|uniref:aminopeptidase P N-terminal domain-containing protein n=1 Tax=Geitlerinema sp. PCC 9228 TaxID=111611 RepID=UPI0008F9DD40|nr:aminopeptidase P N-terminal domain-containing protein [Geitlerinema sp. PCC 9228]
MFDELTIDAAEYAARREQFMAKIGHGTAIFRSAPMAVMHKDVEYPFRQESTFYYFTGFNEPDAVAVFAPHHDQHQYILFVQPRDKEKETWTGYRVGVEGAQERYGADIAYSITELEDKLPQYLQDADRIYYHLGRDRDFNDKILQLWQRFLQQYPKRGQGPMAMEDPSPIVFGMRSIKSDAEIAMMRQAANIAAEAHIHAQNIAQPGMYEYQVQADMEQIFRRHGALGPAYPSIVASGENACILHYVENQRQMQAGDLLLIDAGCSYGYYNSDITRTFPISGEFTPEQKAIYDIVLDAQQAAFEQVQPGNAYNLHHDAAVQVIVSGLVDLGLLVGDVDELIEQEKYKPFFMHRTGHWLGLDVHDVGLYKYGDDSWQTLQPNQVLTVEPGIYISPHIELAEDQPEVSDRFRGIGVRIEDDVLVTPEGHEILTAAVPK